MTSIIDHILELTYHEPDLLGLWFVHGLSIKGQAKLLPLKHFVDLICPLFEHMQTSHAFLEYKRITAWYAKCECRSVIALTTR